MFFIFLGDLSNASLFSGFSPKKLIDEKYLKRGKLFFHNPSSLKLSGQRRNIFVSLKTPPPPPCCVCLLVVVVNTLLLTQSMTTLPPAIATSGGGGSKKPFSYCPGGIDFSELKSPKIARRIAKHQAGITEPPSPVRNTTSPRQVPQPAPPAPRPEALPALGGAGGPVSPGAPVGLTGESAGSVRVTPGQVVTVLLVNITTYADFPTEGWGGVTTVPGPGLQPRPAGLGAAGPGGPVGPASVLSTVGHHQVRALARQTSVTHCWRVALAGPTPAVVALRPHPGVRVVEGALSPV